MKQLPLPMISDIAEAPRTFVSATTGAFSHGQVSAESARLALEERFAPLFVETTDFSRRTVSFQAGKVDVLHNWIHYREGFSNDLVTQLFAQFDLQPDATVLDPFAGSCTTLLAAKFAGLNATGIELLPHCALAWQAKAAVLDYDPAELNAIRKLMATASPPPAHNARFPHVAITWSAFPAETERQLMAYRAWFASLDVTPAARQLLEALLMSVLEEVSYTRKDGQYLRWDGRAEKIVQRNATRLAQGKPPLRGIDKGDLPDVRTALLAKFDRILFDIRLLQSQPTPAHGNQVLVAGNTLYELPRLADGSIDAVITSPPYANRYDYTRTYALELAFLNVKDEIFALRQAMLSCTVENKPKDVSLAHHYAALGAADRYEAVAALTAGDAVLGEIQQALETRAARGEINNSGVVSMIRQYFAELALVYCELLRVCLPGAHVAFVNDNVRYAGETIPVDTVSSHLAAQIGFEPVTIYVIPQRKGNSSQQMKRYGRRELRKSITIWRKPVA